MTSIGYFLSSEERTATELIEGAVLAERAGFRKLAISDHFHLFEGEPAVNRQHHLVRVGAGGVLSSLSALWGAACRWSCPDFSIPLWAVRRPDESGSWSGQDRRHRGGGRA